MSAIFQLFRLQQIDTQSEQTTLRLRQIDAALLNDAALKQAREAEANAKSDLDNAQRHLKVDEAEADAIKIKIELNQNSLYGGKVRNPKELQDLQSEFQALQRQLKTAEDHQLECMLAVEDAEEKLKTAQATLETVHSKFIQRSSLLRGEQGTQQEDLERLSAERQAVVASLDGSLLNQYEAMRKKRAGVAVARILNNACSACGTTLNASLIHSSRTSEQPTFCDGCGRILYGG